jgi:hypothetical protein
MARRERDDCQKWALSAQHRGQWYLEQHSFPLESVGFGHLFLVFPINLVHHTINGVLDTHFVTVVTIAKKNEAEPALNRCLMHNDVHLT